MTKFESALRDRARRELHLLESITFQNRQEVETQLENLFSRKLWWLSKDDERRLLTLSIWAERYQVTVGYLLRLLIPYYQNRFQKRRKQDRRKGLPCRIPTLTGKASQWLVRQQLDREFPNQENRELWRQQTREQLIRERDQRQNGPDEGFMVKRKRLTDYEWPQAWLQSYQKRIAEQRRRRERQRQQPQKPYRNNPWM